MLRIKNRNVEGQNNKAWYTKKRYWAISAALIAAAGWGCEGGLAALLGLLLLLMGVTPDADFAQSGRVKFNVLSQGEITEEVKEDEGGEVAEEDEATEEEAPSEQEINYVINVFDPPGTDARVEEIEVREAREVGTFSILVDSSGSMEGSFPDLCPTCPHDPQRLRVDATRTLAKDVLGRTSESRIGLFDFGPAKSEGFATTRVLTPYTSNADELINGSELTVSEGGTFIYDSLCEILDYMDQDIQQHFQSRPITKAIILVSDGQDTESTVCTLESVITKAQGKEIPIHVIGMGAARDDFKEHYQGILQGADPAAVDNAESENEVVVDAMRRLAGETGGFYASLANEDDIVKLAEIIATGLVGGYSETSVVLDPIPPSGTKVVGEICGVDAATGEKVAECQPWEFVAP